MQKKDMVPLFWAASYQFYNRFVHLEIGAHQIELDLTHGHRVTIDQQSNAILMEMEDQRSNGTRFIDWQNVEMRRIYLAGCCSVQGNSLPFAIQEEGHLSLHHRQIDHK